MRGGRRGSSASTSARGGSGRWYAGGRRRSLVLVDAYLAVVSKREVRDYAPRAIEPEAERRILEAGRLAGSSKNRQARRFVVVRDEGVREEVASCVYAG